MNRNQRLKRRRLNRAYRVRRRVRGEAAKPRICVHRTNMHIYAQMIDDQSGRTICEASSVSLKLGYGGNVGAARKVGEELGRRAKDHQIEAAGFDRGAYRYHGRIKALADGVRSAGVKF